MKLRTQLALTALAALALLVAACSQTASVDHYPTFAQAMDHLVGPGKWSAQSHSNGKDNLLTVTGLTIKLPGFPIPADESNQLPELVGSDGTITTGPDSRKPVATSEQVVEIATVEIKKPLDKKTLETLLATADWKNQKETKLADSVVLKGVKQKLPMGEDIFEFNIEQASVKAIALNAAGADAPAGKAGFLKALRFDELGYNNFKMSSKSKDAEVMAMVGSALVQGVAFDGEMLPVMESLDPSGLAGVMSAMTAKVVTIKDTSMDFKDPDGAVTGKLVVALISEKDVKAMGAFGDLTLEEFKFDLIDEEKRPSTMSLAKVNMRGFDMSAYMKRLMPLAAAAAANPDRADKLMADLYTLGDIFVSPFSLDEVSMSGLDINIADMITIKMAEGVVTGPYRAGQMPATQKSSLKGLEIILPEDEAKVAEEPRLQELYDFGQKFGMTRFHVEMEGDGNYDAESGKASSRIIRLTIKDLLEISGSGEMGGLTEERLEKLNSTSMTMAGLALMAAPGEIFGDVAIHNLNLKLEDQGLTNRLLAYAALTSSEDSEAKLSADDIRQQILAAVPVLVMLQGREYLANPDVLAQSLTAFFKEPGSLEIKIAAQPPVGVKSAMEMGLDPNAILNSMNISLSANGEEATPLKFAISK